MARSFAFSCTTRNYDWSEYVNCNWIYDTNNRVTDRDFPWENPTQLGNMEGTYTQGTLWNLPIKFVFLFSSLGQNMYWASFKPKTLRPVNQWYNEKRGYTFETKACTEPTCGHYTQVSTTQTYKKSSRKQFAVFAHNLCDLSLVWNSTEAKNSTNVTIFFSK